MGFHQPVSGSGGGGGIDLTEYLAPSLMEGRLTLATGTPVTTSNVTAATTLYFTPFDGNIIGLYDGSAWGLHTLSEISIAVPAQASQMYDVFLYDNSGVLTLELTAWTNDTTRATALTTQDGVYVRTGATTRRYLGSFRTTSVAGQVEDSTSHRYLWNYYNRVSRQMQVVDTTNSWSYATATWRAANNSTSNRVDFVIGVAENPIVACVQVGQIVDGDTSVSGAVGIGVDVVSANSAQVLTDLNTASADVAMRLLNVAQYVGIPGIGYHFLQWIEYARNATVVWYGDGGFPDMQSGLLAIGEG